MTSLKNIFVSILIFITCACFSACDTIFFHSEEVNSAEYSTMSAQTEIQNFYFYLKENEDLQSKDTMYFLEKTNWFNTYDTESRIKYINAGFNLLKNTDGE